MLSQHVDEETEPHPFAGDRFEVLASAARWRLNPSPEVVQLATAGS
jgi:hypothetical protein